MNLEPLIADLRGIIEQAQGHAVRSVNALQVASNFTIGQISQTPSAKLADGISQTLSGKSESSKCSPQRGSLCQPRATPWGIMPQHHPQHRRCDLCQPRATPWGYKYHNQLSPERAA